jgi:catechol 2,3-dioxygenase-like lactoylglutathione lyase family enzyme
MKSIASGPGHRPPSRLRVRTLFLGWLIYLVAALVARADAEPVRGVDSIGITVTDLDRSVAFYHGVLGFETVSALELDGTDEEHVYGVFGMRLKTTRMKLGDESIELMQFLAPGGRLIPADSRSNDRWFQHVAIIVSNMDRAYRWLRDHGVEHASSGPQRLPDWNPNAGGIEAFYFRDPDGNHLEILAFPPDKGAAKWHRTGDALFLGIDHTAIVVGDTDTSLAFYRDALGFKMAGTSENYGVEQEHLNNVFGARLRITALRAGSGPGVELLEYLAPRTGRATPVDTLATDLWHWQVNASADVGAADAAVRSGHYAYVSPGPVEIAATGHRSLMIRDPDGHALLLDEAAHR